MRLLTNFSCQCGELDNQPPEVEAMFPHRGMAYSRHSVYWECDHGSVWRSWLESWGSGTTLLTEAVAIITIKQDWRAGDA